MKLQEMTAISPDKRQFSPSKELVLSRRNIGIEIELEGMEQAAPALNLWNSKSDGSLRNGGIELVSDVIRGGDIVQALTNAEEFAKSFSLVATPRCSVHIHLDVRHLDRQELVLMTIIYCILEQVFFRECGDPEREHSNHCRPVCSSVALVQDLTWLISGTVEQSRQSINGWNKYTAYNLLPVLTQGSVEFRHHSGTYNKQELIKWINLIFSLAKYTKAHYKNSLQHEVDRVCADGEGLFNEVFPSLRGTHTEEVQLSMIENARFIQPYLQVREGQTRSTLREPSVQRGNDGLLARTPSTGFSRLSPL